MPASDGQVHYSIVGEGTYTQTTGGNVVIPTGSLGIISNNGTSWSIDDVVALPSAVVSSENGQSTTIAQSQKRVTDIANAMGITGVAVETDETLIVGNTATTTTGQSGFRYFQYENKNIFRGRKVIRLRINSNNSGTLTVVRIKGSGTANFEVNNIVTLNVTAGSASYNITAPELEIGETIALGIPGDTALLRYNNTGANPVGGKMVFYDVANSFWRSESWDVAFDVIAEGNGVKSATLESLIDKTDYIDTLQPSEYEGDIEVFKMPSEFTGSSLTTRDYFHYQNSPTLVGKKVSKVRISAITAGAFTVMKIINPVTANVQIVFEQTIQLTLGTNDYDLNIPTIAAGEFLAFRKSTDVGNFRVKAGDVNNDGGGAFIYRSIANGVWGTSQADMGIGVFIEGIVRELQVITDLENKIKLSYIEGKRISFLGDSITTYQNFIPAGNANFYPNTTVGNDVDNVNKTWWKMFLDTTGTELMVNNSWSNSRVSGSISSSFNSRLTNLGTPDILFIFGGTNDFNNNVPLGNITVGASATYDIETLTGAYMQMLKTITTNLPNTRVICMTPMRRGADQFVKSPDPLDAYNDRIIEICKLFGVEYIDTRLVGITPYNRNNYLFDSLHPNYKGMQMLKGFVVKNI